MSAAERFARLPTGAKLLLILTAVLLPIGAALWSWLGESGIRQANEALKAAPKTSPGPPPKAMQSLIARNALALRIAANGALAERHRAAPATARSDRSPSLPASRKVSSSRPPTGEPICAAGTVGDTGESAARRPRRHRDAHRAQPGRRSRSASASSAEWRRPSCPWASCSTAARGAPATSTAIVLHDGTRELRVLDAARQRPIAASGFSEWPIGNGDLIARIGARRPRITTYDRLVLLLPVLMWVARGADHLAARQPAADPAAEAARARRDRAMQPGGALDLPRKLGPSQEIQELRDAFGRAVARVEESDREMAARSKASGGWSAKSTTGSRTICRSSRRCSTSTAAARTRPKRAPPMPGSAAGSARCPIVHRNHFAEMEENRGIALRPLMTELAAELRAGAPETARSLAIDLELDARQHDSGRRRSRSPSWSPRSSNMRCSTARRSRSRLSLRRTSELTARLTLSSPVLVPDEEETGKDAVRADRRRPGQAAALDARPEAWPLQR